MFIFDKNFKLMVALLKKCSIKREFLDKLPLYTSGKKTKAIQTEIK